MEILIVAAELAQVTPPGEIGDAVSGLSRALSLQGHSVTVALPKPADLEASGLSFARRLTPLSTPRGNVTIYDGQLTSGVAVVLLESQGLTEAQALLDSAQVGTTSGSSAEPLASIPAGVKLAAGLGQAVAALVAHWATGSKPFEVVHGHGLAGSALPLTGVALPMVLTVYDTCDHGYLTQEALDVSGLEVPESVRKQLMNGNQLSVLRAGTFAADVVAAPSSIVIEELRALALAELGSSVPTPVGAAPSADEGSNDEAVAVQAVPVERPLHCVLGGIDYATNNPATDSALPNRFDAEGAWGKGGCKAALFRELELASEPEVPLVVWTGPLATRAGVGTLQRLLSALLNLPIALVVAGSGTSEELGFFTDPSLKRAPQFRFIDTSSPSDLRRVLAAADLALCSQHLPNTGQAVRIAQRFGTVPVAYPVAGSHDAIVTCDPELRSGTGFLASSVDDTAFLSAVEGALAATRHPAWSRLRRRVMRQDLSWERPARRYGQLYKLAATA